MLHCFGHFFCFWFLFWNLVQFHNAVITIQTFTNQVTNISENKSCPRKCLMLPKKLCHKSKNLWKKINTKITHLLNQLACSQVCVSSGAVKRTSSCEHCVASRHAEKTHTALQATDAGSLQQCAALGALGLDRAQIAFIPKTDHTRVAYNSPDQILRPSMNCTLCLFIHRKKLHWGYLLTQKQVKWGGDIKKENFLYWNYNGVPWSEDSSTVLVHFWG